LNIAKDRKNILIIVAAMVILVLAVVVYFYVRKLNSVTLGEENPTRSFQLEKNINNSVIPEKEEAELEIQPTVQTE
jgi:flagellar basal body-associated protein FliL